MSELLRSSVSSDGASPAQRLAYGLTHWVTDGLACVVTCGLMYVVTSGVICVVTCAGISRLQGLLRSADRIQHMYLRSR